MKVKNAYSLELPRGQKFSVPSATEPGLAYSIKQLVADYSVGQLPSMAELQPWLEDNDEEMTGVNDLRFADRADALEKYLAANNIRRSIFDRVKKQHDFKREQDAKELAELRERYSKEQPTSSEEK